jgi:hypothetical protein
MRRRRTNPGQIITAITQTNLRRTVPQYRKLLGGEILVPKPIHPVRALSALTTIARVIAPFFRYRTVLQVVQAAYIPLPVAILPHIRRGLLQNAAVRGDLLDLHYLVLGLSLKVCVFPSDRLLQNLGRIHRRVPMTISKIAGGADEDKKGERARRASEPDPGEESLGFDLRIGNKDWLFRLSPT